MDAKETVVDFTGTYDRNLDSKGRLVLPAPFRKLLPERVRVIAAPDADALYVFTEDAFTAWKDSVFEARGGYNPTDQEHIQVRRVLNAMAATLDIDSAARISISEDDRAEKGLDREVCVVGNEDRIEIWDRATWKSKSEESKALLSDFFCVK